MMSIVLQQRPSFITFTSSDKKFWKNVLQGRFELSTFRLWDWRSSYWATEAHKISNVLYYGLE